ncbi:MAG TPA: C40 family peptidase [Burkholderiales bacterium]|nr:C40 family peptidase [Burkholderiales bacterium]
MRLFVFAVVTLVLAGCGAPPKHYVASRASLQSVHREIEGASSAQIRELALHALSLVGTPYRFGGTSPDSGFDCSGLVFYVYQRGIGVALPRDTQRLSEVGASVLADALEPGDLVFFNTTGRAYSHVGIYLGEGRFIHAPTTGGAVQLVDIRDRYWQMRYDGARRLAL